MIKTDVTIGQIKGVTLLEFGTGEINMRFFNVSEGLKGNGVSMKTTEPRRLGKQPKEPETTTDEWKPQVMMTFSNPESVNVVIEQLQEFKKEFFEK